jgi:hypothetical protein
MRPGDDVSKGGGGRGLTAMYVAGKKMAVRTVSDFSAEPSRFEASEIFFDSRATETPTMLSRCARRP